MRFITLLLIATALGCGGDKKQEKETIVHEGEAVSVEKGKELFENAGNCAACHQPDQKIIGPSIVEIVSIYQKEGASITEFLREKSEPIVDPSQYEVMKTNFSITKQMSDQELAAIEKYMNSFLR